jgi:aspartate/glutamate racemase
MKRIGPLGRMSWKSSMECYRLVNEDLSQQRS